MSVWHWADLWNNRQILQPWHWINKVNLSIKAFHGEINTWSTCPSGVVLSSLSSVELEQPFFTLFGLSFREQNKSPEWIKERKSNSFSCPRGQRQISSRANAAQVRIVYQKRTKHPAADDMFCSVLAWEAVFVLYRCSRFILYLYDGVDRPWRQDMVPVQPTGTLDGLLFGTFIMTLLNKKSDRLYKRQTATTFNEIRLFSFFSALITAQRGKLGERALDVSSPSCGTKRSVSPSSLGSSWSSSGTYHTSSHSSHSPSRALEPETCDECFSVHLRALKRRTMSNSDGEWLC